MALNLVTDTQQSPFSPAAGEKVPKADEGGFLAATSMAKSPLTLTLSPATGNSVRHDGGREVL